MGWAGEQMSFLLLWPAMTAQRFCLAPLESLSIHLEMVSLEPVRCLIGYKGSYYGNLMTEFYPRKPGTDKREK